MDLRPGHKEESVEINLTPLIDVVFLLLIFFMVSSTFDRYSKLKVQLPQASATKVTKQVDPVTISIDSKGKYYINDRQLVNSSLSVLKQALQKTVGDNYDQAIVLRADARTPHQAVVRAMDAASQLGLTRLSIATLESK